MSHQSDRIYYKQPIKFPVLKVNGYEKICSERPYLFFYKRGGSIHILGLLRNFLWIRLRILVMEEMSLEV